MFEIVIKGIITGLVLSIYVGATFFAIIETSLRRGPAAAMILNSGVWVSDISIILLAYAGASGLMDLVTGKFWIKIAGGAIFMAMGLAYFFRKPHGTIKPLSNNKKGIAVLFAKGFAINTLNPGVYFFWFGAMVFAGTGLNLGARGTLVYFISIVSTVIVMDVIKVFTSGYLRRYMSDLVMRRLFRFTGAILTVFGLILMIKAFPGVLSMNFDLNLFR